MKKYILKPQELFRTGTHTYVCIKEKDFKDIKKEAQKELLLEITHENAVFNCSALNDWVSEKYKLLN